MKYMIIATLPFSLVFSTHSMKNDESHNAITFLRALKTTCEKQKTITAELQKEVTQQLSSHTIIDWQNQKLSDNDKTKYIRQARIKLELCLAYCKIDLHTLDNIFTIAQSTMCPKTILEIVSPSYKMLLLYRHSEMIAVLMQKNPISLQALKTLIEQ